MLLLSPTGQSHVMMCSVTLQYHNTILCTVKLVEKYVLPESVLCGLGKGEFFTTEL